MIKLKKNAFTVLYFDIKGYFRSVRNSLIDKNAGNSKHEFNFYRETSSHYFNKCFCLRIVLCFVTADISRKEENNCANVFAGKQK